MPECTRVVSEDLDAGLDDQEHQEPVEEMHAPQRALEDADGRARHFERYHRGDFAVHTGAIKASTLIPLSWSTRLCDRRRRRARQGLALPFILPKRKRVVGAKRPAHGLKSDAAVSAKFAPMTKKEMKLQHVAALGLVGCADTNFHQGSASALECLTVLPK
jgi:hypothetical protein